MNVPKISLKIIRHNHIKNLLGDSYDDVYSPFPEVVNVGTYTLAHTEGMQENLSQQEDVTEYMNELHKEHNNNIGLISILDIFDKDATT